MELTRIINGIPAQSYPIEWVNANKDNFINGDYVKNWVLAPKYEGNFVLPNWNGTEYYEAATAEEIANNLINSMRTAILKKYEYHRANGITSYNDFRALLVEHLYKVLITENEAIEIGAFLKPIFDLVQSGDWKNAKRDILLLNVPEAYMQEYYDIAKAIIENYINLNYED